jgi:drug/metabolite transporter (DMT)-like permease
MLFLKEVPAPVTLVGIALVMGGAALVVMGGRRRPSVNDRNPARTNKTG